METERARVPISQTPPPHTQELRTWLVTAGSQGHEAQACDVHSPSMSTVLLLHLLYTLHLFTAEACESCQQPLYC